MKKFLTFHGVNGDTILIRPEFLSAAAPNKLAMPDGKLIDVVVLYMPWGAMNVKENIEQVEAMLTEPDFTL